jgi:hypothetical protein
LSADFFSATYILQFIETDWSQVRDMPLPTDARGSLIGLVRYGHRPPEKLPEINL